MGQLGAGFHQAADDAQAVQAGHLDIEEDDVGGVLFDQLDGVEAVIGRSGDVNLGK
jgi:hypothetical protein